MRLSSVELTGDILKEILSYTDPCNLLIASGTSDEIKALSQDERMLYKIAHDYFLPYYEGVDLKSLCEYLKMEKSNLVIEATRIGDEKIFFHWIDRIKINKKILGDMFVSSACSESKKIFIYISDLAFNNSKCNIGNSAIIDFIDTCLKCENDKFFKMVINNECVNQNIWIFRNEIAINKNVNFLRYYLETENARYITFFETLAMNGFLERILMILNEYSYLWEKEDDVRIYNTIMKYASKGGHVDIVEKMMEYGATNYTESFFDAVEVGHVNVIKSIAKNHKIRCLDLNDALKTSIESGDDEIVKTLLDMGVDDINNAFLSAVSMENITIMKILFERRKHDINIKRALLYCLGSPCNVDILNFLINKSGVNLNLVLLWAVEFNNYEAVQIVLNKGANNYEEAINYARELPEYDEHTDIIELIENYKK